MNIAELNTLKVLLSFAGLMLVTAGASGSPQGLHKFLQHEQTQPLFLPRFHEPVPTHVPVLSNSALIHLWQTNPLSPILRAAVIEKQLYEAVTAQRNLDPTRYDRLHPTIGRLVSDHAFFVHELTRYDTHPARFVHYNYRLVPILRGEFLVGQTGGTEIQEPGPTVTAVPGGIQITSPPPTTPTTPIPVLTPAPQSMVILGIGMATLAATASLRRRRTA